MLIVLPPSETKAPGGIKAPMALSFPSLHPVRTSLLDALTATDVDTQMSELKIPAGKRAEAEENLALRAAPVMPAIRRYTGVLYDALDPSTLADETLSRLAVGSALFGLVRAGDMIPRYRVSGGSKLGGKTMRAWWGTSVSDALAQQDFVVDMRSGAYQQLGPVAGALTVRVEQADTGKVVSHFNKRYKGELARALAPHDAASAEDVADIASAAGFDVAVDGTLLTMRV
ncbi:peroxide stress protein YaaA [Corynebacterium sp. zg912]|uniref:Peroxide stress protein YaaA n=1 Tax=Corynebacterium wankanglinii TaxID=2735136 RepID=A0A7H0K8U6_9CORY|nr:MULTISPECIES: peroxide stress protein YaaA [Corynebacterium]MBA1837148.1 peroxide stress protein YaaA [Corynebacterium wankanglinii]MCR5928123.1 peroxide stress protein YaaA [Corynebacterium sp. zg912]QNP93712.1 peroxide stress protein YaaA [Corynebacterium wankanglinii]